MSEFSDDIPDMPDILGVSFMDTLEERGAQRVSVLKTYASQTSGLRSKADLKKRVLEFVHAYSLGGQPVTLGALNRRFARPCSACGTTATQLVAHLLDTEQLVRLESLKGAALFSRAVWDGMLNFQRDNGDVPNEIELRTNLLSNAL